MFKPTRYLLKKQIEKNSNYIKGVVLDAGGKDGGRYRPIFKFEKYISLDIDFSNKPDIIGSVEDIPLGDESVDSIICIEVLQQVKNPAKAVEEFYRVLKPEGYCLVAVPQTQPIGPVNYFTFSDLWLEELFKKSGFKIVTLEQQGGMWALIAQMQVLYVNTLFRADKHIWLKRFLKTFFWLNGRFYLWLDGLDTSQANMKYTLGWLIIVQKHVSI